MILETIFVVSMVGWISSSFRKFAERARVEEKRRRRKLKRRRRKLKRQRRLLHGPRPIIDRHGQVLMQFALKRSEKPWTCDLEDDLKETPPLRWKQTTLKSFSASSCAE